MRTIKKTITRILSFALVAIMLVGAVPISSIAATDAPLTGEVGSGWEELGDLPSSNEPSSTAPEQPGGSSSDDDNRYSIVRVLPNYKCTRFAVAFDAGRGYNRM